MQVLKGELAILMIIVIGGMGSHRAQETTFNRWWRHWFADR